MSQKPTNLLFVCRECDRACDGPDLRKYLKKRLKEDGLHKEVRIVRTECMGVCPGEEYVSIAGLDGTCQTVKPERDRDEIYERLTEDL